MSFLKKATGDGTKWFREITTKEEGLTGMALHF